MNRCQPAHSNLPRPIYCLRLLGALCTVTALAMAALPALAQTPQSLGSMRNFPDASLRGTLVITAASDAELNGRPVRMAPGMRLFSTQNTLVMAHNVLGQKFTVNYLIENSTGMLLTAWILSNAEAAQPRAGSGVQRNYGFDSDPATK